MTLVMSAGTSDLSYLVEAKAVEAAKIAARKWVGHLNIQKMAEHLIKALTPYCTGTHKHSPSASGGMVNAGVSEDTGRQGALGGCRVEGRSSDADARVGGVVDDASDNPSGGGGGAAVIHSSSSRSRGRRRRRRKGAGKATTAAGGDCGAVAADDDDDDMDSAILPHQAAAGTVSCVAASGAGSTVDADSVEQTEKRSLDGARATSVNELVGISVAMTLDGVDGRAGGGGGGGDSGYTGVHSGDDAGDGRAGSGAHGRGGGESGGDGGDEALVPPAVDREDGDGSSGNVIAKPYSCDGGSGGVLVDRPVAEHEHTTRAAASEGGGRTGDDVGGAKGERDPSSSESCWLGRLGETLLCPISLEVMVDPVVAADGITYCRQALQQHIDYAQRNELELRSPTTGLPMQAGFHDNVLVRSLAQEYVEAQRQQDSKA